MEKIMIFRIFTPFLTLFSNSGNLDKNVTFWFENAVLLTSMTLKCLYDPNYATMVSRNVLGNSGHITVASFISQSSLSTFSELSRS